MMNNKNNNYDSKILPFVFVIYFFSILIRNILTYTKLFNIHKDLSLTNSQLSTSFAIYFIGYVLFMVPSNYVVSKVTPSLWICLLGVFLGMTTIIQGFCYDYYTLLISRFFSGAFSSGVLPGLVYYISLLYPWNKIGKRISVMYSVAYITMAMNGLFGFLVKNLHTSKANRWRLLFWIIGAMSSISATICYFALHNTQKPNSKESLTQKMNTQLLGRNYLKNTIEFFRLFQDFRIYAYSIMFFTSYLPLYSLANYLPSIIKELFDNDDLACWLYIPPYVVSALLSFLISWNSDRLKDRSICLLIAYFITFACFLGCIWTTNPIASYLVIMIAIASSLSVCSVGVSWSSNNMKSEIESSAGMGFISSVSNASGFLAGYLYSEDGNSLESKHCISATLTLIAFILCAMLRYHFHRKNIKITEHNNLSDSSRKDHFIL